MRTTAGLLWSFLLGRHPAPALLQACADLELTGVQNRVVRLHARNCAECQEELRSAQEVLDFLREEQVRPAELAVMRERIVCAIASVSEEQEVALSDVRRLMGSRSSAQMVHGRPTAELRNELAAFLGHHAADSILRRMAA
jgi:hypothetical protein